MQTGTAFDDMDNDFDAPAAPRSATALHPFEAKGLGKAPFRCTKVDEGKSACAYCGTRIKYLFSVLSADGCTSVVGSECVLKTAAELLGFKEQRVQLQRRLKAAKAEAARVKKAEERAERRIAFANEFPAVLLWVEANRARFDFAGAMSNALADWGSLTPGQLAAVERCIQRDADHKQARAAEQAERMAAAPVLDITAIEQAFGRAKTAGVRYPKLRIAGFVFSLAGAASVNAGAVYVKERADGDTEGQYLGKVTGNRFLKVRECTEDQQAAVLRIAADPKAAALAHGKEFGVCSVCARTLTDAVSIANGIGPICAERFGW